MALVKWLVRTFLSSQTSPPNEPTRNPLPLLPLRLVERAELKKYHVRKSGRIGWDGERDPENPLNWPTAMTWRVVAIVSALALVTSLSSASVAAAVPEILEVFHSKSTTAGTLTVSIFVLGYAVGPLAFAPLSEIYGRSPVYKGSSILFIICTIICPLSSSLSMLIAFRLLSGIAGAAPLILAGSSIGDMFQPQDRGMAMAIWGLTASIGPVLSPVFSGFLVESKGWQAVFWFQAIIALCTAALTIFFLPETYPVAILEAKTKYLIRKTGNSDLRSELDLGLQPREAFLRAIVRPVKMLALSPIILFLSSYLAFLFGILYLLITSFTKVFQTQYKLQDGVVGLSYLGLAGGLLVGFAVVGRTADSTFKKLTLRNGGVCKPEFSLPCAIIMSPFIPAGLFWYGWSAQAKTHWIVPILGTSLIGVGMVGILISSSAYIVGSHPRYAASAIAAITVARAIFGALLPLAGQPLYDALGLGWGNSVLAFVALALLPIPLLFYKFGERLRKAFPVCL